MSSAMLIAAGFCLLAVCYANPVEPPCAATQEINVVCDASGNAYVNPSVARCEGVHNANSANCPRIDNSLPGDQNGIPVQPLPVEERCGCPRSYIPVCAINAFGGISTYDNECHAECSGESDASADNCPRIDNSLPHDHNEDRCACGLDYRPVCVYNADGSIRTYDNYCHAQCVGDVDADADNCPRVDNSLPGHQDGVPVQPLPVQQRCSCPRIYFPVCASNAAGVRQTYSNKCLAECVDAEVEHFGDCPEDDDDDDDDNDDDDDDDDDDCICTSDYNPVCGRDGVTYGNKCAADCADVDISAHHECPAPETPQHLPAFSNFFRDLMKKKRA